MNSFQKTFCIRYFFCFLFFVILFYGDILYAQSYWTTFDLLTFGDVPSYSMDKKIRLIFSCYSASRSTHLTIIENGNTIELNTDEKNVHSTWSINYDYQINDRFTLGILPTVIYMYDVIPCFETFETWFKLKYLPSYRNNLFYRLAIRLPIYENEGVKKQVDLDFATIFNKQILGFQNELLLSFRYRFNTRHAQGKPPGEYAYGITGHELHYRLSVTDQLSKLTQGTLFVFGYISQNKKEPWYEWKGRVSERIYKAPFKTSVGITLSLYSGKNSFWGNGEWFNLTYFRDINWRNELGGWGIIFSIN